MKTNIIIDLSNLVWCLRYAEFNDKNNIEKFAKALLIQKSIEAIDWAAKKYSADGILVACDSKHVWRKNIYPEYKGNRDKETDLYYEDVIAAMEAIQDILQTCTDISVVSVPHAEADDIIAVASRISPSTKTVISSSDKDFIQLTGPNVILYSPVQKKERVVEDTDFELFVKCIRGDTGDNIPSAYPRVRMTRLQKAWSDSLEMISIMETVLPDGSKVGDKYNFNRELIDLSRIPIEVKADIEQAIMDEVQRPSHFNTLKMMQYLGKNDLKEFAKSIKSGSDFYKKRFIIEQPGVINYVSEGNK